MKTAAEFSGMRYFVLLTALAGSLLGQQAQPDWRFAHPEATLVGSFKVVPVLDSPFLAEALKDVKDPQVGMMLGMARGMLGGVTEVRFSMLDNGTKEPDVVALISGRLDEALVGMMSQNTAKVHRIDANTILMGNGSSMERALARMTSTAAAFQPRALDAAASLSRYDFWVSGKLPDNLPMTGPLPVNLKALALGLSVHDNAELELSVLTASPAMAEALIKEAHKAEAEQASQFRGMLMSSVEGSTARFRVNVPRDIVLQAMRNRSAAAAPKAGVTPFPAPNAPPARRTIIIDGLDNGPKEIPLQ